MDDCYPPCGSNLCVIFWLLTPHGSLWGITTILIVGFINPHHRITVGDLLAGASQGVKYALSVGAVCAAIGVVVGVVNATAWFPLGFMVTNSAVEMGESLQGFLSIHLYQFLNQRYYTVYLVGIDCCHLHFNGCWPTNDSLT